MAKVPLASFFNSSAERNTLANLYILALYECFRLNWTTAKCFAQMRRTVM